MSRLPTPGSDDGTWGSILNEFLAVEHNTDGTLKKAGDIAAKYVKPVSGIPETDLSSGVQTKLNTGGSVGDATPSVKGVLQLAGDLAGTAAAPTIASGAVTDSKITAGGLTQSKIINLTSDLAGKYVKPGAGIPKSDLSSSVQTSLDSADAAVISTTTSVIHVGISAPLSPQVGDIWLDTNP